MMLNPQKSVLRGCLLIVLLLGACAPPTVEQPTAEPVTVRVVLLPYLTFAPLFIAEEEGYFAEQGLQIEFVKMRRSSEAVPSLAEGELDVIGGTSSTGLLNAIARGATIRFVADKGYLASTGCAFAGLVARRALVESGELESVTQLRGRRIALNPVSTSGYRVEKLLNTAGLTLDDVETFDISNAVKLEALEKGTIDVAIAQEPWLTRILQAGHAVLFMEVRPVTPDFQLGLILYGPTHLDDNPEAGKRFMVAYLKGVQQYNQGKTEGNLEILAEYTELDRQLLDDMCWPSFRDNGHINVRSTLDLQAWALEKGYLDAPVTEDQFWDPSFVEHANEVLGAASQ